ncbi:MAG TPA: twin-arginine translocase subunit TatC [Capsulimonadaceae bacterium]|nr:twin-arginine translocase subunit TatC [Capsulimonadaceae bacterium]
MNALKEIAGVSYDEKRAELTEHLGELRARIIRSALYVFVGAIIAYNLFPFVFRALSTPIVSALHEIAKKMPPDQRALSGAYVFHSFTGPFFLHLKLSVIGGVILAVPAITMELWGFIAPALTPKERRPVMWIAPFSSCLFLLGAGLGYWIMPAAVHWFLLYLGEFQGAILLQDPESYILFVVQMMLAFGIVFQLPVVMLALGRFGIIRSKMLVKYWRYITVGITVLAMIICPSNDPLSMTIMAAPLVLLFYLSIGLVRLVEPKTGN